MARPRAHLPRIQVRTSEKMRALLHERAEARFWSVNAEIVSLIERGLAAEAASTPQA